MPLSRAGVPSSRNRWTPLPTAPTGSYWECPCHGDVVRELHAELWLQGLDAHRHDVHAAAGYDHLVRPVAFDDHALRVPSRRDPIAWPRARIVSRPGNACDDDDHDETDLDRGMFGEGPSIVHSEPARFGERHLKLIASTLSVTRCGAGARVRDFRDR